jgi:hypothetical protein
MCDLWGRGHHKLSSANMLLVLQVMLEVLLLQLLVLLLL